VTRTQDDTQTGWYSYLSWSRPIASFELRVIHRFGWKGIRSITCRPLNRGAAIISRWFQSNTNTEDAGILQTRNIKIHIDWYCLSDWNSRYAHGSKDQHRRKERLFRDGQTGFTGYCEHLGHCLLSWFVLKRSFSATGNLSLKGIEIYSNRSLIFLPLPNDWDYLPQTGTAQEFLPSPNKTIDFWNYTS